MISQKNILDVLKPENGPGLTVSPGPFSGFSTSNMTNKNSMSKDINIFDMAIRSTKTGPTQKFYV